MIANGRSLIKDPPVEPFEAEKKRAHGVSYGLSEAGYDIRVKQPITLHPFRRFTIASTVERFQMPNDLVGIVHDKSTWLRRGLFVANSVVEPGWQGFLTLELFYMGWRPLRIPSGSGIAQVIFHRVEHWASYRGKYQDQGDMPVAAIMEGDK